MLLAALSACAMTAQVEWGIAAGMHSSFFRFHCDQDAYGCRGSATGSGGGSLALQVIGAASDSTSPRWLSFELNYAHRMVEVEAYYSEKVGFAESAYAMDYGMLHIGYLPRFYSSPRWGIAPGLRLGGPVWTRGAGWKEIHGGLAGPPDYYTYESYDDLESFRSVLGLDIRAVLLVEHLILLKGEHLVAIEAGVDHGFWGQQDPLIEASVNSTDLFLRLAYRFGSAR